MLGCELLIGVTRGNWNTVTAPDSVLKNDGPLAGAEYIERGSPFQTVCRVSSDKAPVQGRGCLLSLHELLLWQSSSSQGYNSARPLIGCDGIAVGADREQDDPAFGEGCWYVSARVLSALQVRRQVKNSDRGRHRNEAGFWKVPSHAKIKSRWV